jgi:hypothetical protein
MRSVETNNGIQVWANDGAGAFTALREVLDPIEGNVTAIAGVNRALPHPPLDLGHRQVVMAGDGGLIQPGVYQRGLQSLVAVLAEKTSRFGNRL